MTERGVLVISDGSVPGLLGTLAAAERGPVLLWVPERDEVAGYRARAAAAAAEVVGGRVIQAAGDPTDNQLRIPASDVLALTLVRAGALARAGGCGSVLWPINAGESPDLVSIAAANADRALLASRLMSVGSGPGQAMEIECPYVDYSDRHLADLVLDMDLPIWTCWWAEPGALPAGLRSRAEAEREHWTAMLQGAGWRGALPRSAGAASHN